jgi:hypothetical protein
VIVRFRTAIKYVLKSNMGFSIMYIYIFTFEFIAIFFNEKFEDTKRVIRRRKSEDR